MMTKCYQIGAYEKAFPEELSLSEMFNISKMAGYDYFELSIDRTEKRIERIYSNSFAEHLRRIVLDSGFPVGSICLSALSTYTLGNTDDDIFKRAISIIKNTIVLAAKTGIRTVQIPGCDMPKCDLRSSVTDEKFFMTVKRITEFAAIHNICLAIENMESDYMDTVQKAMKLVEFVDSPFLQLYPDSGNIMSACIRDGTYLKDMEFGRGHYVAFHLKETRPDKYGGLFYGDGHVDFKNITKKAYELGARRFVLEYWYTGNPNWKDDLFMAKRLCDQWLE